MASPAAAIPCSVWLVRTAEGWRPGIGDPTVVGWLTVAAYLAAAFVCGQAFRDARRNGRREARPAWAWAALTACMLGLGVNKQLDLHDWFTVVARSLALQQGWYAQRRVVQLAFVAALALLGGGVALASLWSMRRHLRQFWLAGCGACFIMVFVVVRASSFHHAGDFLHGSPSSSTLNWVLELGGIACIASSAVSFTRRRCSSRPSRATPAS